jgi:NAD dependent epimerase/dehydratase
MIDWSRSRVLVTGAGGFIGSHLTERLVQAGAKTRALVRYTSTGHRGWLDTSPHLADIEVLLGDVRDRDSMRKAFKDIDVVFHLAALIAIPYSYDAPQSYVDANVQGTLNVLELARDNNLQRVVHTSTSEVYGTAQYVPIDEKHPLVGQSPYSASKIGADEIARSYYLSFGLPVVTVRPFNTYGPRQSARAVIPTIITQALAGQDIKLGSMAPTRDFNYVGDTADGFIALAGADEAIGKVCNIGSGREITIGDLATLICKLCGSKATVSQDFDRLRPANSEVERLLCDMSLANSVANFPPRVSLEDGLQRTIEWFRGNMAKYRPGEYIK